MLETTIKPVVERVCVPWGCDLRDSCKLALREGAGVIKQFIVPQQRGEYCEHYEPTDNSPELD